MKRITKVVIFTVICSLGGCDAQDANQNPAHRREASPESPEVILVSMAGWTQTAETMGRIERAMVRQISAVLPNYRITVKRRLLGLLPVGDSELFLGLEYEAWKQKKKTAAGRDNQFVAVGHSSGATAIYGLLENGTFKNGPNAPAFLGLVDMGLPLGPHDLTGKTPHNGARRTEIVHYHIFGTDRIKGIRNISVGADHFSVVNSRTVTQGLAAAAADACLQNSIQEIGDIEEELLRGKNRQQDLQGGTWKVRPDKPVW